jgi:hypothetical protein
MHVQSCANGHDVSEIKEMVLDTACQSLHYCVICFGILLEHVQLTQEKTHKPATPNV